MSHFAVPLSMFCISVLNYILSCIKSVTFGHVPTVSTDGSPHTHQTFALLTPLSSTAQHTAPLLGSVEMLKGFWVLSEQLLDHRGDVVCNISTRPYPWLPGKIIKSMMTEKKECITPRSCLTKPLNICTKERWKWLTDGSRAWLAVMIRCGQVFMM